MSDNEVKVIGTRHGEKMYEVLLTKEEAANLLTKAIFTKYPLIIRDLNYGKIS